MASGSPRKPTRNGNGSEESNEGGAGAEKPDATATAELVGTREIEISRIETGRVMPGEPMKERIALVLGKPTFELFEA